MENRELVIALRRMQHTVREISAALGISKSRVGQLLNEQGIEGRLATPAPRAASGELILGPFITRAEAVRRGLKKYFSGVPCEKGHIDVCWVDGGCSTCSHERTTARQTKAIEEWNQQNTMLCAVGVYGPYISQEQAQEKNLKRFYNGVPCRHGHVGERYTSDGNCVECARISGLISYHRPQNKERSHARAAVYRANNRARLRADGRRRARLRDNRKIYLNMTDEARFVLRLRSLIRNSLNGCKSAKSEKLLSCSIAEAKAYLQNLFEPGMTFNASRRAQWHIDHVRPISSFDDLENSPEQQLACCFFANLQPLWAEENLTKCDTWTREMEAHWIALMRSHGFTGELFPVFNHELAAA